METSQDWSPPQPDSLSSLSYNVDVQSVHVVEPPILLLIFLTVGSFSLIQVEDVKAMAANKSLVYSLINRIKVSNV